MRLDSLRGVEPVVALLTVGSAEWHHAWRTRRRMTQDSDFAAEDRATGFHQFRHLRHPVWRRRWWVRVPARKDWRPS